MNDWGEETCVIRKIDVERFEIISRQPFDRVLKALEARMGHPDMTRFQPDMAAAKDFAELERVVQTAVGDFGLMEFARFNIGLVLRKESGRERPRIVRLLVGNPLIMKKMAVHVPEAASYAPVTVLIDERPDGVHLSY